jgi:predicted RNase H-like HicB family nuclease
MKFLLTLFRDEDGVSISDCHSIPGHVSQGKTEQYVEKNIQEAFKKCLEVRSDRGIPVTIANRQVGIWT